MNQREQDSDKESSSNGLSNEMPATINNVPEKNQQFSLLDEEEGLQRSKNSDSQFERRKTRKSTNFHDALKKIERTFDKEYKMYKNSLIIAFVGYLTQFLVVGLADRLSDDLNINGAFYVTPIYNMALYAFGIYIFLQKGTTNRQKIFVILALITALIYTVLIVIYLAVAAKHGEEWSRGKIISFLIVIIVHFGFNVFIPVSNFRTSVEVLNTMQQRDIYKLKVRTHEESRL